MHVARMAERKCAHRVLVWIPEGKRSIERLRRRWEDNIRMDIKNVVSESVDWIDLVQDRDKWRAVVKTVMNFRVSYIEEQAFIHCVYIKFLKWTLLLHGVTELGRVFICVFFQFFLTS